MALQVWLPLIKDLRNQGLGSVQTTNNTNFILKSGGKLGTSCLDLSNTVRLYSPNLKNLKTFSFAFWYRPETSESTINWNDVIGFNDSKGGLFRLETSYSNSYMLSMHNNTQYGIIQNVAASYGNTLLLSSASYSRNVWYHIAVTVEEDDNVKAYVNGELKCIVARSDGSITGYFNLGELGGSNKEDGSLNDLRIYDHCLSPMEVKKLSQGLVLHYNLSDDCLEGTTNLVTTEDGLSNTCYNGATSKYGYGSNTDMYKNLGVFNERKSTKVYMGTTGLDAYPFVYFDTFNATGTTIQTLSFNYFPTLQNTIIPYSYNGTYNFSYTTNKTSGSNTNASSISIPVEVGKWNHITITAQKYDTTNTSRGIGYIRIGSAKHTSDTSNYWLFNNVQVETKDHATGYAGVGGSRTANNVVYDNSGFCNNGTSNNIVISTDTPKYKYSSIFNGTNSYIKVNDNNWMIKGMSEMTVNLWAKATTWPASGKLLSCTESGGFNLEAGNSGYWRFPIYVYTNSGQTSSAYKYDSNEIKIADLVPNEWNMITLVYNNTGTKTYLNGELHHTYTNTSYGINFNTNARLFLGCEANTASPSTPYFNGKECDFRIYATALSASDVKSLYQNCATIDSDGTIRGKIR